jgi:hypothetical protein
MTRGRRWGGWGPIPIPSVILILILAFFCQFASFIVLVVMGNITLFFIIFYRFVTSVFFLLERLWLRLMLLHFFVLFLSLVCLTFYFLIFLIVMGDILVTPMPSNRMALSLIIWTSLVRTDSNGRSHFSGCCIVATHRD